MSRFTLKDLAEKVLKEERRPLTVSEIWEIAKKRGYDKLGEFLGRTPWLSIGALIYVDMRDNPKSPFIKIDSKPRKFFLKTLVTKNDLRKIEKKERGKIEEPKKVKYKERDIHPFLAYFIYTYMNVYSKTIHHEKSKRNKYSQWLHPDMVGVYFPIEEWKEEVFDLSKEIGSSSVGLFSFEIKKELGFHNLRESFFQAVSNSSWANEGYLVVANIDQDEELFFELNRLSNAFGIGVIKIDIDDPDNSEEMFPPENNTYLDWETMNKLATENSDFEGFLKRILIDLSSKEIRKEKYDKIYDAETLLKKIKKQ